MKTKYSIAQQMMIDDGFPPALFETQEQRKEWWDKSPARPIGFIAYDDPKAIERRKMAEQLKAEQNFRRDNHLANLRAKKQRQAFDTTGKRWDPRRNKWVADITTQQVETMSKWKITPYDANGNVIQRGVSSIDEGTDQVALLAKLGASYHRCPKDSAQKIIVQDANNETIREWVKGEQPDLPKPAPAPASGKSLNDVVKQAKAKGEKRAKKEAEKAKKSKGRVAALPPFKPNDGGTGKKKGKPGVIDKICETLRKPKGATIDEIVDVLSAAFPDRDPKSMRATVQVQVGRQKADKVKDEKRGTVYSLK